MKNVIVILLLSFMVLLFTGCSKLDSASVMNNFFIDEGFNTTEIINLINITFGDIWVNESGDSMTGDLNMTGNSIYQVSNLSGLTDDSYINILSNVNMTGHDITGVHNLSGASPINVLDEVRFYKNAFGYNNITAADHLIGNLSWTNISDFPGQCIGDEVMIGFDNNGDPLCALPVTNDTNTWWSIDKSKYIYNRTDINPNGVLDINETMLNITIANVTAPKEYIMYITTSGGKGSNVSTIIFAHTILNLFITPGSNSSQYKFAVFQQTTPTTLILHAKRYTGQLSYLTPFSALDQLNVSLTIADDDTYQIKMVYK